MNTVDALKDLYKTLCGSDYAGDPNPTDAEMISAIAKDASTGGGGSDGGESENKAYFPLAVDTVSHKVTTPFDDIVDACEKGIPCAVVIDNKIDGYWGVGRIIMEGSNVNKIMFVNQYSINTAGSTKSVNFSIFNLSSDGTVTLDQAAVIAS